MTNIRSFTPAAIDMLRSGRLCDPATPGLFIEVRPRAGKVWRYRRRVRGTATVLKLTFGSFPRKTIANAREWARALNAHVEEGVDPRAPVPVDPDPGVMTVARAHSLYMVAVEEGRGSRAKRRNKPRTVMDKLKIFRSDIAPALGDRPIHDVVERDLIELVLQKGKSARVRANRLATELNIFFGWAASLRGLEVGLAINPAYRLADLRFPEQPRQRRLDLAELGWFLQAVAEEERDLRRGMLLWLLTAARFSEVVCARSEEVVAGVWTIPAARTKNRRPHVIALGPWGRKLIASNTEWVFPAPRADGPRLWGWYQARDRVRARMTVLAGRTIAPFTPHDFRRTARSNTKRLKVEYETAEAMMNHVKSGLERIYDCYDLDEEKAAWFLTWENEIIKLARVAGVADRLDIPGPT
jgi:integrase